MDLKITGVFTSDTWALSGSVATHGAGAGQSTWTSAMERAANPESDDEPLLKTEDDCQYFRDYCADYGAWDDAERAAWSTDHCNALLLQMIAGDMREAGLDEVEISDDEAWSEYQKGCEAGRCSGNIYRSGEDVFFSLCH